MSSAPGMCQYYPAYTSDAPEDVSTVLSYTSTIKRVTRQRVRYRSLAARKPKELRPATESLSVSESDPLPTTTHTKGLS